jgi:AAA domain
MNQIPFWHAPDAALLVDLRARGDEHGQNLTHRQTRPLEVLKDGKPYARGIYGKPCLSDQGLAGEELSQLVHYFRVGRAQLEAIQMYEAVLDLGLDVEVLLAHVDPLHDGKRRVVCELADASMERLTPGLFDELETIFSREDPVLVDVDPSTDGRSYGPLGERILLGKLITEGIEPPTHLEPEVLIAGAVHWFHGTADTGKTWLAGYLASRRIEAGENVLIWDKENGPEIYGERLEALGCDPETIDRYLFYHGEPNLRLDDDVLEAYTMRLEEVDPVLVIYDSARGFLTSAGLEENSNDDLDKWYEAILKPVRNRKCAAMVLDHDPKDGNTARGAGRKKDLCDVMWAVKSPYPFDESKVGMVRLVLEKGRRGGLSPSVSFSVGGSEEGFIFARSEGTIELEDDDGLTDSQRKALEALENLGTFGATWKQWWDASGMAKTTFTDARSELENRGLVEKRNDRYFVTGGRGPEGPTGPNSDLSGPHGDEVRRSGPFRRPDLRTSPEVSKQLQNDAAALQTEDDANPRTVAGLFANPPEWLTNQLDQYHKDPARYLRPLCAAVATEVLLDATLWEEVREEVERALKEAEG